MFSVSVSFFDSRVILSHGWQPIGNRKVKRWEWENGNVLRHGSAPGMTMEGNLRKLSL